MTNNTKRKIWQTPWRYAEAFIIVVSLLIIGFALQSVIGEFNFYLLAKPVNFIVAGIITFISVCIGLYCSKSSFARWFCGIEISVALIVALLLLTIIMGLTPQTIHSHSLLGFDVMTSSWAFVIIYTFTLLSLGTLIVKRLKLFRLRDYGFYLNHIGLWLFLLCSGLGYADMERYIMHVREGETEWRVYDDLNNVKELPVAITLNDFDMDFYPPKLAVINIETGEVLPHGQPEYFQIDNDVPQGNLDGWQIVTEKYIHQAVRNSDSTYHEVFMPGASPAIKVQATKDGVTRSGWICGGNQAQLFMTLPLDENSSMVMTVAEPRKFMSDVVVYTQSEKNLTARIEVNKPLSVDNWTIYQYGYDNNAGRLSSYSSFELVYDPWLIPVYIGIIMMMLGAFAMVWTGKGRKEADDDVE